jgi:aspartyl/glutamyl-tRNA(Asn/Gln) amidotransferase C subunit
MAEFSKEELLKIAELSALKMSDPEVEYFLGQMKQVIEYVNQLQDVKISLTTEQTRNINYFREDETVSQISSAILDLAPKKDDTYFVVPKILD